MTWLLSAYSFSESSVLLPVTNLFLFIAKGIPLYEYATMPLSCWWAFELFLVETGGKQKYKMVLHHSPFPDVHILHNSQDYTYDSFTTKDWFILHGTIDFKIRKLPGWLWANYKGFLWWYIRVVRFFSSRAQTPKGRHHNLISLPTTQHP